MDRSLRFALAAVGFGFLQNNDLFPKQETQQSEVSTPSAKDIRADELAQLTYQGTQTIEVNQNIPEFSEDDLSLENGAWEAYGDLDHLNRATSAEAMLNQSLMPTEKRGDISSVKPTGWRNKQLPNGKYLYNRTHLIGFALAGENANWKNLITGTSQLNNPEMLRLEMDINYYLKQDKTIMFDILSLQSIVMTSWLPVGYRCKPNLLATIRSNSTIISSTSKMVSRSTMRMAAARFQTKI